MFYKKGDRHVIPIRLPASGPFSLRTYYASFRRKSESCGFNRGNKIPPYGGMTISNGRGDRNRTCDPLHPMQVLYQAELRPDNNRHNNINFHNLQTYKLNHLITFPVIPQYQAPRKMRCHSAATRNPVGQDENNSLQPCVDTAFRRYDNIPRHTYKKTTEAVFFLYYCR